MSVMPARADLPGIEHEMLARWNRNRTFEASLRQTESRPRWSFYEGPSTANGMPGAHHIEARVFKDLFSRFKTMQGFRVARKPGWGCHGLSVEVAVEKELGLSGKIDIEAYGVAEFNKRCRESVLRHADALSALTTRMGYWTDLPDAYWTMDSQYIESVWWALKGIFDKKLLVRDLRVSPYCPRCGTTLSSHEMGQQAAYREVTDLSVIIRFPVTSVPLGANRHLTRADLLIATTNPWALPANTAVAVHPEAEYVIARKSGDGDTVVVAEALHARVLGAGWHILATVRGADLIGTGYSRPFDTVDIQKSHVVVAGDFVTKKDGTGLAHLAPSFGVDDMEAARANRLPVVNPVCSDGRFEHGLPLIGGMFFKDADKPLIDDLAERGLVFKSEMRSTRRPHCRRCNTVLLDYALPSWYINTTTIMDRLLAENEKINWKPATIKNGQYSERLRDNPDWVLSRTRYWGTPLPVWECPDGHLTCVGSLAELSGMAGRDLSGLDPHRPYIDDVVLPCPVCGLESRRVPEVIDAWFDSGSMPFAQYGAPLRNLAEFEQSYPAQFICEATDQTRGWFYALMVVATLVFGQSCYKDAVCPGLVVDEQGRKMSKKLGNVIQPFGLMDGHGADAVRWFFAASGSPWGQRQIDLSAVAEIVRKVLLTYWNTVSFFVLHVEASSARSGTAWTPETAAMAPRIDQRPLLDQWLLSQTEACARDVTAALESYDTAAAGRRLAALIDDLSNWYIRRSRRRFAAGPGSADGSSAFATLHEALVTLTKLMAPIAPFLSDYLWGILRPASEPESVHLAAWPVTSPSIADAGLLAQMTLARRLVKLGRSARSAAGVRTRQPLSRARFWTPEFETLPAELRALVAEEINVHELIGTADVISTQLQADNWAVVTSGRETVALDLSMSPSLRAEGWMREFIRLIKNARRNDGLSVADRIAVRWAAADPDLAAALSEHGELIAAEVLAVTFGPVTGKGTCSRLVSGDAGVPARGWHEHTETGLGLRFWLTVAPTA